MSDYLPSIDLDLSKKLKDPDYRREFFLAETSAHIARQLIRLRKRRGLSQSELAALANTGQPAISRAERADYRNWSFNTLRKLAEAMDARLRVIIEPAEDVLIEYGQQEDIRALPGARLADLDQPNEFLPQQPERVTVPENKPVPLFVTPPRSRLVWEELQAWS